MTLHEAIEKVLLTFGQNLTAKELTSIINQNALYTRRDGFPVSEFQIQRRIRNYPGIFNVFEGKISLKSKQINFIDLSQNLPLNIVLIRLDELLSSKKIIEDKTRLIFILEIVYYTKKILKDFISTSKNDYTLFKHQIKSTIAKSNFTDHDNVLLNHIDVIKPHFNNFFAQNFFPAIEEISQQEVNRQALLFLKSSGILSTDKLNIHSTPQFINKLLAGLSKPKSNDLVFDPACGKAETLLETIKLNSEIKIIGQELDHEIASIGSLMLLLNNFNDFSISASNALVSPAIKDQRANVIVCDPPSNKNASDSLLYNHFKSLPDFSITTQYLEMMLSKLDIVDGRMIVNLPIEYAYRKHSLGFRKKLIDGDMIEAVINLPMPDIHLFMNEASFILVVNNRKPAARANKILFIDSSKISDSFYLNEFSSAQLRKIDKIVEAIVDIYDGYVSSTNLHAKLVPNKHIAQNNFELWSGKYTSKITEILNEAEKSENLVKLSNLVTNYTNYDKPIKNTNKQFKQVQISDLNEDTFDFYLEIENLDRISIIEKPFKLLSESALLLAKIGMKLKPTYFRFSGESIAISPNVYVFKVKDDIVNIEYLVSQLNSSFVLQQIEASRTGHGMPTIKRVALMDVSIPLPTLSEQYNSLAQFKEQQSNKLTLTSFINSIQLANNPDEIKSEIEKFAKTQLPEAKNIIYQREFDFKKFPFTENDIVSTNYIVNAKEEGYTHLLIIDNDKKIYGVLTAETTTLIKNEVYAVINAYARFVNQTSTKYLQENTNKLLDRFSHTTKNILGDIINKINSIIETPNPLLADALKTLYYEDDDIIEDAKLHENRTHESFVAFNRIEETFNILQKHLQFFKKYHESIRNRTNDEISEIQLNDFIENIKHGRTQINIIKDEDQNPSLLIKPTTIEHAFIDLIDNAQKHGSNMEANITFTAHERFIEITIANKVKPILSEDNYKLLGSEELKDNQGIYKTGLHTAFVSINEDNSIHLCPYSKYKDEGIFEVLIKLRKK